MGVAQAQSGPTIDVWYGDHQVFGSPGVAQRWVNILGNVSDPDGVASLEYQLNGGSWVPLSIGPDTRRLSEPGDFNADIDIQLLNPGENQMTIRAADALANQTLHTMRIDRITGQNWPLPYSIDWGTVTNLQDVAVVVDGFWTFSSAGVRSVVPGYDRLIDLGDINWTDYEITVPITVHAIDPRGYNWPSVAPSCGIVIRWKGHWDWGGWQPLIGYLPSGATFAYDWASGGGHLMLQGDNGLQQTDTSGWQFELDTTYIFKMRVESMSGTSSLYSAKVWQATEPEPAGWLFSGLEGNGDLMSGSVILLAHHVDATFGNTTITPATDPGAPIISNINLRSGTIAAGLTWQTDDYTTGRVRFGQTTEYETDTLELTELRQDHRVVLSGLIPDATYHYMIEATNDQSVTTCTADMTFVAAGTFVPSTIHSDEFTAAELDTDVWTFVNPLGDCGYSMIDGCCVISVPDGVSHDIWTAGRHSPRIMQSINNADFEVETLFNSTLNAKYQTVGVLVEGLEDRAVRMGFHHDGGVLWAFAAGFTGSSATTFFTIAITGNAPLHLRVTRDGDIWRMKHSFDGQYWAPSGQFSFPMVMQSIGPYVGNAVGSGQPAPAHTNKIDYFRNTAAVGGVDPCDGNFPDSDNDGLNDCYDGCPYDADKQSPGACGCGVPDSDTDLDNMPDCIDDCPDDPLKTEPGFCGCGVPDTDSDGNGVADCLDGLQIVSDDFNTMQLNTELWNFSSSLNDATLEMTGFGASVHVPGGTNHDIWTDGNMAALMMQSCANHSFGIEAGFETIPTLQYQIHGLLIQENASKYLRCTIHSDGTGMRAFVAAINGANATVFVDTGIPAEQARHIRVMRDGPNWTLFCSADGANWQEHGSFSYLLVTTSVGVVVGNASGNQPAPDYTAVVDYFFNTASPIDPEDADQCPDNPDRTQPNACGCDVPDEECGPVHAIGWRALRAGTDSLGIPLDSAATDIATATVEPRRFNPLIVEITFDLPLYLAGTATATNAITQAPWPVQQTVSEDRMRMYLQFAEGDPPASSACQFDLSGSIDRLEGDTDCLLRILPGDVNGDGVVNLMDVALQKSMNRQAITPENARHDLNGDGILDLIDTALVRSQVGNTCCE